MSRDSGRIGPTRPPTRQQSPRPCARSQWPPGCSARSSTGSSAGFAGWPGAVGRHCGVWRPPGGGAGRSFGWPKWTRRRPRRPAPTATATGGGLTGAPGGRATPRLSSRKRRTTRRRTTKWRRRRMKIGLDGAVVAGQPAVVSAAPVVLVVAALGPVGAPVVVAEPSLAVLLARAAMPASRAGGAPVRGPGCSN